MTMVFCLDDDMDASVEVPMKDDEELESVMMMMVAISTRCATSVIAIDAMVCRLSRVKPDMTRTKDIFILVS